MTRDKIIVTGGLGYIGSHTCVSLYNAGYVPVVLDNLSNSEIKILDSIETIIGNKIPFYHVDCRDLSELKSIFKKESNIKGVIHFAALKSVNDSINRAVEYYDNNINSLINIIKCIEDNDIKSFVFSSSCTVYGIPKNSPVSEDAGLNNPTNPYGFTKYVGERIINDRKKNAIILRYFNPIGAHPSFKIGELPKGIPNNLVPYITQSAIGIRNEIVIHGKDYNTPDGTCIRDYIHVCDLAEAHVKSLEYSFNFEGIEIFNIGTGNGISVKKIIDTFEECNNVKLNYIYGKRREGDIPEIYANPYKANNILGWKSKFSLEEGLKSAWEWEKNLFISKIHNL